MALGVRAFLRRPEMRVLLAVLLIAAVYRVLVSFQYGFMDERPIFWNVVEFISNKTLIPIHTKYPTFFSYIVTPITAAWTGVLLVTGQIEAPADITVLYDMDSLLPILAARWTNVVIALATLVMVYVIGARFFNRWVGVGGAALLALSTRHVEFSGYALPDVSATFFATLTFYFSLRAYESRALRDFVFAGVFAGLAASAKYNVALCTFAVVAVHLCQLYADGNLLRPRRWLNHKVLLSALVFFVAFFVTSPGWILATDFFWEGLQFERKHMAQGQQGAFGTPVLSHLWLMLRQESTVGFMMIVGLIFPFIRRRPQHWILALPSIVALVIIGSFAVKRLHYIMWTFPALDLLAAAAVYAALQRLAPGQRAVAAVCGAIIIFIWPVVQVTALATEAVRTDNRTLAYEWIQEHVPHGSSVYVDWGYVPVLIDMAQYEDFETEHAAILESQFSDLRAFEVTRLNMGAKVTTDFIQEADADYLVTTDIFFNTYFNKPPPPEDTPFYEEYFVKRELYSTLMDNPESLDWRLAREFKEGAGDRVFIFERTD